MPTPSPYLVQSLSRLKDRGSLIRRDVELMLEGLALKTIYLNDLRAQVNKHRQEDVEQLTKARTETWSTWDERMKRVEEWGISTVDLERQSSHLRIWRDNAKNFGRAQALATRYASSLTTKASKIEARLKARIEKMEAWSSRLKVKEAEIREFIERQSAKGAEIVVSRARKQPYLDFVYWEREEEGVLAVELKTMRATLNRALDRIARAESWVTSMALSLPAHFEIRKNELLDSWRPYHQRYSDLRNEALSQAIDFEEGRKRLRWIYDQISKMRVVVSNTTTPRRPLLERLFGRSED